ncbi:HEAT repeat domain-containing protein [Paludibaculum fermentans]|uniref:HEAT repeat domain-containing protein n=2 Tax=Paludibaculum fermentans TaxID=1473598 RepID=A0A7S7SL20_PALFE|nr:HEAT repeat domain-containing protein [Paludibaculum fermentans]QOY89767.1 HEAT repeat domain-containing protein [Paludibaculum fermentans]
MPTFPEQFDATPVSQLLLEAEQGLIGFDQRLLKSLLARREETLAALVPFAAEPREEVLLDLTEQSFDLFRQFRDPAAIPFYLTLLAKRGDSIPDELVEAFADLGAPAVEPLLDFHETSSADDRPDVVFLLVTLGVHDPRIRALVEDTLARDPYEGALCAGLYGDPSLRDTVNACAEKADEKSEERKVLLECVEALNNERGAHEPEEFDILALYPDEAMPLFDQMDPEHVVDFFACADPAYRTRAAASFSDDDYPDDIRDRLLPLAANDSDPKVRGAALRALGERVAEPEVRELLTKALETKREHKDEWLGALIGLAGATGEPEVHDALMEAYATADCRAAALHTMWRSFDSRYKKYFSSNLKSEDLDIRRQAIQGVGAFPMPDLSLELVPMFKDDEVREEALFAYALSVRHNTTPKSAGKLLDMISDRADGLNDSEEESVCMAIDRRLEREGYQPVFFPDDEEHDHDHEGHDHTHTHAPAVTPLETVRTEKIGRNDPCPCGSGKKYKKCCGGAA